MIQTAHYDSPVGKLFLAAEDGALIGLWMVGQKYFPEYFPETGKEEANEPILKAAKDWLDRYFAGERPGIGELKLAPKGSEFRRIVWEILCEIPYGELTTYGEIAKKAAKKMGRPHMSGQAVGGAVGHNAVSIIIPCHRVVGTNGSLTGYAGGIQKKIQLLSHEGVSLEKLTMPR